MKTNIKLLLTGTLAILIFFNIENATAQVNLGGGFAYGSEIERGGINLRGGYLMDEQINIRADFTYFFPETDGNFSFKFHEFNVNGSYWLEASDQVIFYPFAGLNFSTVSYKYDSPIIGTFSDSDTEVGFNIGAGAGLKVDNLMPFLEAKYVISEFDQAVLTIGLIFKLDN